MAETSPDQIRTFMSRTITALLEGAPGLTVKAKVTHVARELGFTPRRLDDYRYGEINRPLADEYLALDALLRRRQSFEARSAALRNSIEESRRARAEEDRVNRGVAGGQGSDRLGMAASAIGQDLAGLGRFAGGVIDCRRLTLAEASPEHQRLAAIAGSTGGEFTEAAAAEMDALGLAGTSWLYRAEEALTVLFVGRDIPIVANEERERVLGRPVADQALPPAFLRLVLGHLTGLLVPRAKPTVHRITARLGGHVHRFDRMGLNWHPSGVMMSSCQLGAA